MGPVVILLLFVSGMFFLYKMINKAPEAFFKLLDLVFEIFPSLEEDKSFFKSFAIFISLILFVLLFVKLISG